MKVVVCGATGFIGRNIAERLAGRPELDVTAVRHLRHEYPCSGLTWVDADLTHAEDVATALQGADIVIQAAATTSGAGDIVGRPYIHVADNAVMNSHIFRTAYDLGVKHVVFFSCTVMYPSSDRALKEMDFTGEIAPQYFGVGWTKVYLERMAAFYAGLGRTKYTVLRHSNIYGPHDKYDLARSHMFGATVTKVMTAADGKIVVWGEGKEARDLLHVDDLVDCVELAMTRQEAPFALYNVGYGEAFQVRDVVRRIIAASGRDLAIEYDTSKPTIPTSLFVDCGKVDAELGWTRRIAFDEGIRRTLAWYRSSGPGTRA